MLRKLGFTKEAFKDKCSDIRLEAYRVFGYTEEAENDENEYIRREAKIFLRILK